MISQRTKVALQAAKARGVVLGNAKMLAEQVAKAAERDAALAETLRSMVGLPSRTIAARLTEMGVQSPRGGPWSHRTVQRVMARLGL